MPSVFESLRELLDARLVVPLALHQPDRGAELVVVRSTCGDTLGTVIKRLGEATAQYDVECLDGLVPSARFFKGDQFDVSKITALKKVAERIKSSGSMTYDTAASSVWAERRTFFVELNAKLAAAGSSKVFHAPAWSSQKAGNELLARLPLVRVPLENFGARGGYRESLLIPIIPGISDADLLEHIDLIKDLREAHAAAARRGDEFDAAKFRLLIDAQPPCAGASLPWQLCMHRGARL